MLPAVQRGPEGGEPSNGEEGEEEERKAEGPDGGRQRPPSRIFPWSLQDLGDLAGLEAAGTHTQALHRACRADLAPHRDQVDEPAALRDVVGVADLVADGRAFSADIATLSHADSLRGSAPDLPDARPFYSMIK